MKEKWKDKLRRIICEKYDKFLKWIIREAVEKHDDLSKRAFLAYTWGRDEVTDYHVLAERSYPDTHIYGTKVDHYEKVPLRCEKCTFYSDGKCVNKHRDYVREDDYCSQGAWTGGKT